MIWAQDANGVIGDGKGMVWSVPDDSRYFKDRTSGYAVVMGRGSWDALGRRPLPNRENIVVTRQNEYQAPGAHVAHSLEEGIELGSKFSELVWIAGGSHIYAEGMALADELVVTDLELTVEGESLVCAPEISEAEWRIDEERSDADWRPRSGDARWRVTTYVRR